MLLEPRQHAVIYDATCGFCSASVRWLERLDWRGCVGALPNQLAGLQGAVGLSRDELEQAVWVISPSGRRYRGHKAVAAALDLLLPFGLPLFRGLAHLPVLCGLGRLAYGWVSRNRHRFPSGPAHLGVQAPWPSLPLSSLQELSRRRAPAHRRRGLLPHRVAAHA
jgi:predicted DCC family thiol-disulfide oxidoreductase YuxK